MLGEGCTAGVDMVQNCGLDRGHVCNVLRYSHSATRLDIGGNTSVAEPAPIAALLLHVMSPAPLSHSIAPPARLTGHAIQQAGQ